MELKKHKFNIFPEAMPEDYIRLKTDIEIKGYDKSQPIYLYGNEILDGWNRQRACTELGVKPQYKEFKGTDTEAIEFVVRTNKRRNLTSSQWACIAVEAYEIVEAIKAEARERQGTRNDINIVEQIPQSKNSMENKSSQKLADLFNTNEKYVRDAENIMEDDPTLFEEIKKGKKTITKAKKERKKKKVMESIENQKITPFDESRLYRVIYADPPWKYTTEQHSTAEQETTIGTHYPSLSTGDICAYEVGGKSKVIDICEDDAVLFLWATSPLLLHGLEVMDSWGFTYKASMVWDKVKHNVGHYVSVRHEFILIGTRGKCTPDIKVLYDSVYTEERTIHSRKPDYFRNMIDEIYPLGKRIELFAREKHDGWDADGNQI